MSLVHSPEMTPEKLAANRANARQSQGAATPEGRRRARTARLKHGLRSRFFQEAMGMLGEDPEDFDQIHQGLVEYWQPSDPFREMLVMRLARLMWRLDRREYEQEGYELRHQRAAEVRDAAESKAEDPEQQEMLARLYRMLDALDRHDINAMNEESAQWEHVADRYYRLRETLDASLTVLARALDAAQREPFEQDESFEEDGLDETGEPLAEGEKAVEEPDDANGNPQEAAPDEEPGENGEAPEDTTPSERLEGAWKYAREVFARETARLENEYADWKRRYAADAAGRWLRDVEAHTNTEAMRRGENFLSLEVTRTVRLLRQLQGQDQEDGAAPAEKKDLRSSHDVVENKGETELSLRCSHDVVENKGPKSG